MFTPPPSPRPSPLKEADSFEQYQDDMREKNSPSSVEEEKQMTGRRMRLAVLLVPFVLILITASTRYVTCDVAVDLLPGSLPSSDWLSPVIKQRVHKRNPEPQADPLPTTTGIVFPSTTPSSTTSSTPSVSTATTTSQNLPTIPASPPVLPTPFPQPFDTSLGNNFSTVSCKNFFLNMTSAIPFLSCRPFSLLLLSSSAFIEQAQHNITVLNNVVWGTCNVDPGNDQCTANMAWFASSLQSACQKDLSDQNVNAINTLRGLQAYSLMLKTGCTTDLTTNSYCYVSAAVNSNPSDLYFFQLPLGVNLPNKINVSCSACTKSLMSLYDAALINSTGATLAGLQKTYNNAAVLADGQCGQGYALQASTGGATGLQVGMFATAIAALASWSLLP